MIEASNHGRRRRSLSEKYEAFSSPAAERLRSKVLGSGVVSGYTTVAQAAVIAEELALSAGDVLLDLGGGRGWPGSYIARGTGCRLVACDLPMNALLAAAETLAGPGAPAEASVLRADGRALPFSGASFDGVCHADVLC